MVRLGITILPLLIPLRSDRKVEVMRELSEYIPLLQRHNNTTGPGQHCLQHSVSCAIFPSVPIQRSAFCVRRRQAPQSRGSSTTRYHQFGPERSSDRKFAMALTGALKKSPLFLHSFVFTCSISLSRWSRHCESLCPRLALIWTPRNSRHRSRWTVSAIL